jgi:cell division protein FtsB
MASRFVPAFLITLLVIVHVQLWFGRGSVAQVSDMRKELAQLERSNHEADLRNNQIGNEVRDLKDGLDMVVKPNEIFVQIAHGKP